MIDFVNLFFTIGNIVINHFYFLYICILSVFSGGVIGIEREKSGKPAGLKTHVMICLGSAVLSYLSLHTGVMSDPTRITAQIVSGVGFIGAGTILQSKSFITGLTSASTIWVVAGIGMLIGSNLHMEALIVVSVVFLFFKVYRYFVQHNISDKFYFLTIELEQLSALEKIEDMIYKFEINLRDKQLVKSKLLRLELTYTANSLTQHLFLKRLLRLSGVSYVFIE